MLCRPPTHIVDSRRRSYHQYMTCHITSINIFSINNKSSIHGPKRFKCCRISTANCRITVVHPELSAGHLANISGIVLGTVQQAYAARDLPGERGHQPAGHRAGHRGRIERHGECGAAEGRRRQSRQERGDGAGLRRRRRGCQRVQAR